MPNDPDNVTWWSDSRFTKGSRRAGDAVVPSRRRRVAPGDASVDGRGRILELQAATSPPPEAKSRLRELMVQDVANLTRGLVEVVGEERWPQSLLAAALGDSGGSAAGFVESGGSGVALLVASARRCRLFPELFVNCSCVGRPESGGVDCASSCEKVVYPSSCA